MTTLAAAIAGDRPQRVPRYVVEPPLPHAQICVYPTPRSRSWMTMPRSPPPLSPTTGHSACPAASRMLHPAAATPRPGLHRGVIDEAEHNDATPQTPPDHPANATGPPRDLSRQALRSLHRTPGAPSSDLRRAPSRCVMLNSRRN